MIKTITDCLQTELCRLNNSIFSILITTYMKMCIYASYLSNVARRHSAETHILEYVN